MEENQIGTPATMASTIDKLLDEKRPFLTVKNGKYYSTPFGRMYISIIPDALKAPELRAETEWKLRQVYAYNVIGRISTAEPERTFGSIV